MTLQAEMLAWRSTTPVYTRFISDRRYRALRPYAQRWYEPICQRPCCLRARAASDIRGTDETESNH
jgi:hypothetical protein